MYALRAYWHHGRLLSGAWANSRNIVWHNMLQHVKFENGQIVRATFWMLHDLELVWPRSRNIVALGHAR